MLKYDKVPNGYGQCTVCYNTYRWKQKLVGFFRSVQFSLQFPLHSVLPRFRLALAKNACLTRKALGFQSPEPRFAEIKKPYKESSVGAPFEFRLNKGSSWVEQSGASSFDKPTSLVKKLCVQSSKHQFHRRLYKFHEFMLSESPDDLFWFSNKFFNVCSKV